MVQICFSHVCTTDSSSCSEQKNWKKKRLKQGSKAEEGNQNVVVVAKSPGSSSLYCRTAIAPLSLRYRSSIAPLLLRCRPDIAMLSLYCCSAVSTLLHRYCSIVPPSLSLRCRAAFTPISHPCRAVVEPQPLRPREGINSTILNCCCSTVTPLSLLLSIGRFTRLSLQEA